MKSLLSLLIFTLWFSAAEAQQHWRANYVLVNGANLWYEEEGHGEAVVFISGGPGFSHVYFKPHFAKLARDFRLIYYDAVGRGRSDYAPHASDYSIARDVADLEGLREALHIEKWHVYGHSYGGIVAQQYALAHQDRLYSLILSNTMHSFEMWQKGCDNFYMEIKNQYPEEWETIKKLADEGKKESSPEMARLSVPTLPLAYFYDVSNLKKLVGDSLPWNQDVYYSIVGDDILKLSPKLKTLDFRDRLQEISVPMLILAGRYDRIAMPRYEVQYEEFAPLAEFVMFEKSGHFPFLEETEKNYQVIHAFLRRSKR